MLPVVPVNMGGKIIADKARKGYQKVKRIWKMLNEGNQQKKDIEGKQLVNPDGTPIQGKAHADNYAHSLADAKIAQQEGKSGAAIAYGIGVLKEGYDIVTKVARGANIKETLKDSYKDMQNNVRGLRWGLENPNGNAEAHFAQLDLDKNQIVPGYNNGIAQAQRADVLQSMKDEHQLAQNRVNVAQQSQQARAQIEQAGKPSLWPSRTGADVERFGLIRTPKSNPQTEEITPPLRAPSMQTKER